MGIEKSGRRAEAASRQRAIRRARPAVAQSSARVRLRKSWIDAGAQDAGGDLSGKNVSGQRLAFSWVGPDSLKSYRRALSLPNDRQHRQLMSSICEFGFLAPLVVSKDGEVIVGEQRLKAALALGLKRVPVVRADHLTPLQVRQYRIADNRLAGLRKPDLGQLKAELQEIIILEPEINIEAMGYSVGEFDAVVSFDSDADDADAVPAAPNQALSRPGDLWEIDGHALYCGDARDPKALAAVTKAAVPAVVFADPPYNVPVRGHMGGKGRIQHDEFVMGSGEMDKAEYVEFQTQWIRAAAETCPPGALLYIATDWRALHATLTAALACGLELINLCVWRKEVPGLGSFYRSGHELFLVLRKPGALHRNNVMLGTNGRFRSNCWDYPGASGFGAARKDLALHPTAKPVALIADILFDCTERGDVVLDPFSGSGATMIAAQRTGRRAHVIELDARYVDVAVRRYQNVYGRAPRLAGSGLTLDQLAEREPRPQASPRPKSSVATGSAPATRPLRVRRPAKPNHAGGVR